MTKKSFTLLITTASLGACLSVNAESLSAAPRTLDLPPFSSITLNGLGTLRLHQGRQAVNPADGAELPEHFELAVRNGTLYAGCKSCWNFWTLFKGSRDVKNVIIDITVPEIEKICVNGLGEVNVEGFSCGTLDIAVTGAGTIALQGTASVLRIESTGAAKVHAASFVSKTVRISMTGSGTAEVEAEDELDVSITGSGTVVYSGEPRVDRKISGAGTLRRAGE